MTLPKQDFIEKFRWLYWLSSGEWFVRNYEHEIKRPSFPISTEAVLEIGDIVGVEFSENALTVISNNGSLVIEKQF